MGKKRFDWVKPFAFLILKIAVVALAFIACWQWALRPVYVSGNGMFPALKDGDLCIVSRIGMPYTDDVVAYEAPGGGLRIGRVVAIGGQKVDFPAGGGLTVNGYQPSEEIAYQTFKAEGTGRNYPLTVPEGDYFILDDMRLDLGDSRTYGCIPSSRIIGRAVFMVRRRGF